MNAIIPDKLRNPPESRSRPLVRVVIAGHVDHGKSTLIGRLLHETGSLPDGKLESLKAVSARRGMRFEWSFLLDALQTERDQGITIDTSQIRLRTKAKDFVLIDAPGHAEFLRNMITGAAQADGAILIVDAAEGVCEQTRRHGYLLHLLGLRQLIVVINKMDRIAYDAGRFREIETEITGYLQSFGLEPAAVIPASARDGVGITTHSYTFEWYRPTVVDALDGFAPARPATELDLRFPVQAVYKFDDRRILAGRIESGRLAVGDEVVALPSGQRARVQSIEAWPAQAAAPEPREALAGQSVGITLDRKLFVERGNMLAPAAAPAPTGRQLRARVFWLHREPLEVGSRVTARVGTAEARGTITAIDNAIDPGQLAPLAGRSIAQNHVGEIVVALAQPLAADAYAVNPSSGRIVLEFDGRIAGGGLVLSLKDEAAPSAAVTQASLHDEAARLGALLARLAPGQRLARLRAEIGGRIAFTTSFGLEDQVILHLIAEQGLDIDAVTLDTGRLFDETYALWAATEERYGLRVRAVYPRHEQLEALVEQHGINGFYRSREARQACCHVRKVEPLGRALEGARAWITGLRADQSGDRRRVGLVEADTGRGLVKLSPLLDWTRDAVLAFATANAVPVNPLHARGFVSIGCAPCTRAIASGEAERAGRWWWEQDGKTECGLHARPSA